MLRKEKRADFLLQFYNETKWHKYEATERRNEVNERRGEERVLMTDRNEKQFGKVLRLRKRLFAKTTKISKCFVVP